MPDNTETTQPTTVIKQPENPIKLSPKRNSIELTFTEQRTTRGKNPGKVVFEPDTTNKQAFLDWVGLDNVLSIVKAKVRGLTLGWAEEATDDDTGEFVNNKFIQFAEDFSARGETIGELEEQMEDAQAELVKLDLNSDDPEVTKNFIILGKKIQQLKIAVDQKKRPRKSTTTPAAA